MRKILPFIFLIFFCNQSNSQEKHRIHKIHIQELNYLIKHETGICVFDFWATWCHPCVEELPSIEKLAKTFKTQHVKVFLVSLDFPDAFPKRILRFARKENLWSPIFWLDEVDPNVIRTALGKSWKGIIPCLIIINRKKGYNKLIQGEQFSPKLKMEFENSL